MNPLQVIEAISAALKADKREQAKLLADMYSALYRSDPEFKSLAGNISIKVKDSSRLPDFLVFCVEKDLPFEASTSEKKPDINDQSHDATEQIKADEVSLKLDATLSKVEDPTLKTEKTPKVPSLKVDKGKKDKSSKEWPPLNSRSLPSHLCAEEVSIGESSISSQGTLYAPGWESDKEDEEKNKLRKAIKRVVSKNQRLLPVFKEAHPDCIKSTSPFSDKYNKMILESMGGSGDNDVEKEDKIIKKISSVTTIDK
jgi:hypothetical protein